MSINAIFLFYYSKIHCSILRLEWIVYLQMTFNVHPLIIWKSQLIALCGASQCGHVFNSEKGQ